MVLVSLFLAKVWIFPALRPTLRRQPRQAHQIRTFTHRATKRRKTYQALSRVFPGLPAIRRDSEGATLRHIQGLIRFLLERLKYVNPRPPASHPTARGLEQRKP